MLKKQMDELERLSKEAFQQAEKSPLVVVLDNVRSMHNVGSVFRTSDAFLVEKIYLCGFTPTPPHREIQKTALGATETVAWEATESTTDLILELKNNKSLIYYFLFNSKTNFILQSKIKLVVLSAILF
jgi:tRNA G18 (ribose-2'-O)-methylase SpoU